MQQEENHHGSAATGSGGMDTYDTTLTEKKWSRVRLVQRVMASLSISPPVQKILIVLEIPRHPHKGLMFPWRSQNKWREAQLPRKGS